jgi:rubrerythrin
MAGWSLDDIPWADFDAGRVDPEVVPIVKAASMVESNAADYRIYLCNVFEGDARIARAIEGWAAEEVQHGRALGRWAAMADPDFDYEASFRRFREGYRLPLDVDRSVRGSRSGELIARCMVEVGTSSYYTALGEATAEPVLKAICRRIADDEFAHYELFHRHMMRYLAAERLGLWRRLRIALSRIAESEDDELAYAYYAANGGDAAYDRARNSAAYAARTLRYYTAAQVERGLAMIFRAVGLRTTPWIDHALAGVAMRVLRRRTRRLAARAVA